MYFIDTSNSRVIVDMFEDFVGLTRKKVICSDAVVTLLCFVIVSRICISMIKNDLMFRLFYK